MVRDERRYLLDPNGETAWKASVPMMVHKFYRPVQGKDWLRKWPVCFLNVISRSAAREVQLNVAAVQETKP